MYKSNCENYIEEVNVLINDLNINGSDAIELINIYFECYADCWVYEKFLKDEIRVIKDNEENQQLIAELDNIDEAILFEGDDYVILTNYSTLQRMGEIGDCIPSNY